MYKLWLLGAILAMPNNPEDPFLWLEDVAGEQALNWVKNENKLSEKELSDSKLYKQLHPQVLEILNSEDKIKSVSIRGDKVYNFWRNADHVRGIYREAKREDYLVNKPKWETVLDIDQLGKEENESWVFKGISCARPNQNICLVYLSRGGADATVVREFNIKERKFVKDGFFIPEAKSRVSWIDENTIFIGTDFGEGSLTHSGYPRISKRWKRGTTLNKAESIYEASVDSVSAGVSRIYSDTASYDFIIDSTSFYTSNVYLLENKQTIKIVKPDDADLEGIYKKNLFIQLKSDWVYRDNTFSQGSIIYADLDSIRKQKPNYKLLLAPTQNRIINSIQFSKNYVWVTWLNNVKTVIERLKLDEKEKWQTHLVPLDTSGTIYSLDVRDDSDSFFLYYESFLQPDTLYYLNGVQLSSTELQKLPEWFDASQFKVEQFFAHSLDKTLVPYFVVINKKAKLDGSHPTLLYGYGGFEIALKPNYSPIVGRAWLENGGVYVLANIRGGGEFGPRWHQAALKEKRTRAYEDFEAVAKDLIRRKITSTKHLAAQGGSNGGLLMGNMLTRSPELFSAIVCQVPLLDMKRFNKLLAGASWMAEYGNPDIPEEWAYIKNLSPYHNLDKNKNYPRVFFTTSTRDDRVHPGHARKMVAKLKSLDKDVLYYENIEGGHGGAADNNQVAHLYSMIYTYLLSHTK